MPIAYSVIIPAYNEEKSIETAIRETVFAFRTFSTDVEIVVVDDGSTDGTRTIAKRLSEEFPHVTLLTHDRNRGKGAAIKTGALHASGDVFLFLDCDLATHPSAFASFIPLFPKYDIVIGSRRTTGAHVAKRQPLYRVWLGQCFNLFIRSSLDIPFADTQCGFKAFSRKTKIIFSELQNTGWAFDVELLVRARQHGCTVAEVPVTWRNGRESRVKLSHGGKILKELASIRRITNR